MNNAVPQQWGLYFVIVLHVGRYTRIDGQSTGYSDKSWKPDVKVVKAVVTFAVETKRPGSEDG